MNVRIVCPQFTPVGGTQLAIWHLARYLRQRDHSVRVLTFEWDEMPGVEIRRIPDPMFSGLSRILALRRTAKRDGRSDERRYATGPDDPGAHVVTFHACAQWRLREMDTRRVRFSGQSMRDFLRPVYHRAYLKATAQMERRIVQRGIAGETILTAVSTALANQIRTAYAQNVPIDVTPNGVDRSVYSPESARRFRAAARNRFGLAADDFVVGFVGGDWHRKNLKTFIRTLRAARRDVPAMKGVVLGEGDPGPFAGELPGAGVQFAGLSRNPVEFYAAIDVFYSASPVESFGLPALEAAACGIPIVVCAGVGLLDFLNDDEAIVLTDPFDADAAAAALIQLYSDIALRARMTDAGIRASERLPWSRSAEVIEKRLMS